MGLRYEDGVSLICDDDDDDEFLLCFIVSYGWTDVYCVSRDNRACVCVCVCVALCR